MKIKLIILSVLSLCFLYSCKEEKISMFIGETINVCDDDFFELFNKEMKSEFNNEFSSSIFYQKNFYKQLEKDAVNLSSKHKLSSLLKKTDLIIYNIGNYEIQRFITYDEYSLFFDENEMKNSLELFEYYLYHCLDYLDNYSKNIVVIPLYNSLILEEGNKSIYTKVINTFNEVVFKMCQDFSLYYIPIDKMNRFVYKNNYINVPGVNYLCRQIKDIYDFD